jgi:hypothetical protein
MRVKSLLCVRGGRPENCSVTYIPSEVFVCLLISVYPIPIPNLIYLIDFGKYWKYGNLSRDTLIPKEGFNVRNLTIKYETSTGGWWANIEVNPPANQYSLLIRIPFGI